VRAVWWIVSSIEMATDTANVVIVVIIIIVFFMVRYEYPVFKLHSYIDNQDRVCGEFSKDISFLYKSLFV
jgi:hypothetical protein